MAIDGLDRIVSFLPMKNRLGTIWYRQRPLGGWNILCVTLACYPQLHWLSAHNQFFDFEEALLRLGLGSFLGLGVACLLSFLGPRTSRNPFLFLSRKTPRQFCIGVSIILTTSAIGYPDQPFVTAVLLLGYFSNALDVLDEKTCYRVPWLSTQAIQRFLCWSIFLVALSTLYFREPELFHSPRFWAEDGKFFFAHFFNHREPVELLKSWEYFRIIHNLTAYTTVHTVSVERAPLVFTFVSAVASAIPIAIISFGQSRYWETPAKKLLIIWLYLLIPFSQETWLNLNGTSYTFTFASVLILMSGVTPANIWPYRLCIVISGLTGLLSCLFAPIFGVRAWLTKEREHLVLFLILASCAILQLAIVFHSAFILRDGIHMRVLPATLDTVALVIWARTLATIVSIDLAQFFVNTFSSAISSPHTYTWSAILYGFILVGILGWYAHRARDQGITLLITCFVLLSVFSTVFGIGGKGNTAFFHLTNGMRYFYIPAVIMALVLSSPILLSSRPYSMRRFNWFGYILITLMIHNGVSSYRAVNVYEESWPNWQEQVSIWRNNSDHLLKIWPRNWLIRLNPFEIR